jgi:uroporphyrinogen III methyltransferase / synthase
LSGQSIVANSLDLAMLRNLSDPFGKNVLRKVTRWATVGLPVLSPAPIGIVFLVGAGPGDPGLISVRGAELLASADVVLHDELVHPALLDLAKPDADVRFVGKRGADRSSKQAKQDAIQADLVALAHAGKRIVRLKGGDPYLFGRGSEEAEALHAAGIPFEVVPGISSPLGATAYAGFSLTHRDHASSVVFVSGTTRAGKIFDFAEVAKIQGTICIFMGMHNLELIVQGLLGPGERRPDTPAAIIQWGTWSKQRVITGRLDEIVSQSREANLGSPGLIVVGNAAERREHLRWFDLLPLFGKRVLVLRPRDQAAGIVKRIRERGGEPILWPAIEIVSPDNPEPMRELVRNLRHYDLVVLTSENSVEKLFQTIAFENLDARAFGQAKIAAVGSATMATLAKYSLRADIVPRDFHGDGLAEAILDHPSIKERLSAGLPVRVAFPRARVAREVLPEKLQAAGCLVSLVVAYETKKAGPDKHAELVRLFQEKRIDVVLLSASSTAEALVEALGAQKTELLDGVFIASIGDVTTSTARKWGLDVHVTAKTSTMDGLLDAVEQAFGARRAGGEPKPPMFDQAIKGS